MPLKPTPAQLAALEQAVHAVLDTNIGGDELRKLVERFIKTWLDTTM